MKLHLQISGKISGEINFSGEQELRYELANRSCTNNFQRTSM